MKIFFRALICAFLLSTTGYAQVSTAPPLLNYKGTTLPTNCQVSRLFFKTDATAGNQVYTCSATDTWTQILTAGSGGPFLPLAGGTMVGNIIFTDNTYDIGASGATRPRTGYFATSVNIGSSPAILTGPAAATLQHGDVDTTAPTAQVIKFQDVIAGTSNTAGVNATINCPAGTGTGVGGSCIFQNAPAGTTGTAKNAQVTSLTIAPTGVSFIGTTTNNSATTGQVGEFVSSSVASGSAVSLTTATAANMTSISLTAGDWDVTCIPYFVSGTNTTVTALQGGINTVSATMDYTAGKYAQVTFGGFVIGTATNTSVLTGPVRTSISATTTVYCVAEAFFGVSTMTVWGILRARRVR